MKRVGNRSRALLLLVLIVLAGLSFYIFRLLGSGRTWASYPSNQTVYSGGVLKLGTVLDRNGLVLSTMTDGKRTYAEDKTVRAATLHAVGDLSGNIGTGALSQFASRLIGYNFLTGAYSRTGEGKDLRLSIDADLNVAAYKALNGRKGAVGVVNYKTGEILSMVSSPSYDPLNAPDFSANPDKYEGVFINRFLSSAYTPGSTFKLVTLAAAIENLPDLYDRVFDCEGSLKVGGDIVNDTGKHGKIGIEDALAVSCNVAFAQLALDLGADTLNKYADRLGLTSGIDIDGIKTAAGNFTKAVAGTADLAWSGIGQYNDTVCPANMLRYVSAIANGGVAVNMSLIHETGLKGLLPAGSQRLLSKDTADKIATMMNYDVYKTYGKDNFPGLELYAKSGTAEVGGGQSPHSWFVGYITNKDYPLAFVVVVENGGSGAQNAGKVANTVLQAAIKK
ncbi:peptidoglycan glycosyltransferase [Sporobacter termitidis DSM 10068]|uniref:Peptidoglycan glycosyltransferase n=1 Tax=Sporobacter termitidis DSM 10068 TaxID=1123282 RepID=A0A1M5TLK0_9FIRM|nr:penicillin-binding transpeptidase domain-containing protein [Sporobacter termitidis]SHH51558.1 peptidoglycan glycosyltransferase [Sporobacter termitidis DSM 10068]